MNIYFLNVPSRLEFIERANQFITPILVNMPIDIILLVCEFGCSLLVRFNGISGTVLFDTIKLFHGTNEFTFPGKVNCSIYCETNKYKYEIDLLSDNKWHPRFKYGKKFRSVETEKTCNRIDCDGYRIPNLPPDAIIICNDYGDIFDKQEDCPNPVFCTMHEEIACSGFCLFHKSIF